MSKENTVRAGVTAALGIRGGRIITRNATGADLVRVRINDPVRRRRIVLEAAYIVAQRTGISGLTWWEVAEECEVSTSISTAKRSFDLSLVELQRQVANIAYSRRNRTLIDEAKRLGLID
jgi:hypothetical protein